MKSTLFILAAGLFLAQGSAHAQVYSGAESILSRCTETRQFNDKICTGKYPQKFLITVSLNVLQGRMGAKTSAQERVGDIDTIASSQIRCEDQVIVPAASQEVKLTDLKGNVILESQQILNAKATVGESFSSYGAMEMNCPANDYAGVNSVSVEQSKKNHTRLGAMGKIEPLTLEIAPEAIKTNAYVEAKKDGSAIASQISMPATIAVDWTAFSAHSYTALGATTYAHGRVILKAQPFMAGPKPQGDYGQF